MDKESGENGIATLQSDSQPKKESSNNMLKKQIKNRARLPLISAYSKNVLAFLVYKRYNSIGRIRVCGWKPMPDAGKTVHVNQAKSWRA
jgi:hypothetical protein